MGFIGWYINGKLASRPIWTIFNKLYFFPQNSPHGGFI
jgi:hypothetical protein